MLNSLSADCIGCFWGKADIKKVLELARAGVSYRLIARQIGLSKKTVEANRDARSSLITMNGVGCSVRLLGWTEHRARGRRAE